MTKLSAIQEWVLSPQALAVLSHLRKVGRKGVSAREAQFDLDITSATLARRICDLEEAGIEVTRVRKNHPTTGRKYTRYVLGEFGL